MVEGGRFCGTRLEFYYGATMKANRADSVHCLSALWCWCIVCFLGRPWGWFLVYFSSFILLCILRKPFIQELNIKHTHINGERAYVLGVIYMYSCNRLINALNYNKENRVH